MKITRLKLNPNMKKSLAEVSKELQAKLAKAGFITEVNIDAGKIGLHSRSFRIDVNKLGYNAKVGQYIRTKSGYKRTDVPLWEQREQFNHIVNSVFDKYKISAKIISGPYLVRDHKTGAVKQWECVNYLGVPAIPNCDFNGYGDILAQLMSEQDAIEYCKNN